MARHRPPERFASLLHVATRLFARSGVKRVQMDEIAAGLGVAKGTLYLYVSSKEALFDLALRLADGDVVEPETLPVPTPPPEDTLRFVALQARLVSAFPALAHDGPNDRAEVQAVVGELYDVLRDNSARLKLVAASAVDWPELGQLWFSESRAPLVARLAAWVERGSRRGVLREALHPVATARFVVETLTWFAVHRRFDPAPDDIDDTVARETAQRAVLNALIGV